MISMRRRVATKAGAERRLGCLLAERDQRIEGVEYLLAEVLLGSVSVHNGVPVAIVPPGATEQEKRSLAASVDLARRIVGCKAQEIHAAAVRRRNRELGAV